MKLTDDKGKPACFTDLALRRLKPPKVGQAIYWDVPGDRGSGQLGLSVLASAGRTKTYRATFYLPDPKGEKSKKGKLKLLPVTVSIGRVGEIDLGTARELTAKYRGQAAQGIDPRAVKEQEAAAKVKADATKVTYEHVVNQFIEHHAKPTQRTWYQTQRILRVSARHSSHGPLLTSPRKR
jgi:hypothetical protein